MRKHHFFILAFEQTFCHTDAASHEVRATPWFHLNVEFGPYASFAFAGGCGQLEVGSYDFDGACAIFTFCFGVLASFEELVPVTANIRVKVEFLKQMVALTMSY